MQILFEYMKTNNRANEKIAVDIIPDSAQIWNPGGQL